MKELARWRVRARELAAEEATLHAGLHPDVLGAVGRKKLLIFRELMLEARFPCAERVFEGMQKGFTVLGPIEPTGVFPADAGKVAGMSITDLQREAAAAKRMLSSAKPPQDDPDIVKAVFEESMKEVERGWLRGPTTAEQLDAKFDWWLPARRFGVKQGTKIRAVDDYSIFGHNECTSTEERVDVGGIDNTIAIARAMMLTLGGCGPTVDVTTSSGEPLFGSTGRGLG